VLGGRLLGVKTSRGLKDSYPSYSAAIRLDVAFREACGRRPGLNGPGWTQPPPLPGDKGAEPRRSHLASAESHGRRASKFRHPSESWDLRRQEPQPPRTSTATPDVFRHPPIHDGIPCGPVDPGTSLSRACRRVRGDGFHRPWFRPSCGGGLGLGRPLGRCTTGTRRRPRCLRTRCAARALPHLADREQPQPD